MGQHLRQDVHVKFSVTGPAAMAIPGIIGIAWETLGTGQRWLGKHRCPLLALFYILLWLPSSFWQSLSKAAMGCCVFKTT